MTMCPIQKPEQMPFYNSLATIQATHMLGFAEVFPAKQIKIVPTTGIPEQTRSQHKVPNNSNAIKKTHANMYIVDELASTSNIGFCCWMSWGHPKRARYKNRKNGKNKSGKKNEEQVNSTEEDNWTPWIIVLLDFFYITGMPIDRKNDFRTAAVKRREKVEESGGRIIKKRTTEEITPMREMSIKELEAYFKAASRKMWKILQMEEMNEAVQKKQLSRPELDFIK